MEPLKTDTKLPSMVMCGDHPSITKTELNLKEKKVLEVKERKIPMSYTRISPTSSRTEKAVELERSQSRSPSAPALAGRGAALDTGSVAYPGACVAAALSSFRWPPYLVVSWLLVLCAAHALHALTAALGAALPALRKLCQYFRTLTEESWRAECTQRVRPVLLACATVLLYAVLCCVSATNALLRWAVEPLTADGDEGFTCGQLTKVTDYIDDFEMQNKTEKL
ncbi:uncharacterized protein LOC126771785 isoform X1 [Nymphalis io]|uniref:uncharacterized protein LOC126771785 isoform X1 n=1 Tax=Inachis io TaxID=171585 RepID=UPI00216A97E3|nr:uncharacterized protein LOC126771785 isoform X1 [Nymphalis io]